MYDSLVLTVLYGPYSLDSGPSTMHVDCTPGWSVVQVPVLYARMTGLYVRMTVLYVRMTVLHARMTVLCV